MPRPRVGRRRWEDVQLLEPVRTSEAGARRVTYKDPVDGFAVRRDQAGDVTEATDQVAPVRSTVFRMHRDDVTERMLTGWEDWLIIDADGIEYNVVSVGSPPIDTEVFLDIHVRFRGVRTGNVGQGLTIAWDGNVLLTWDPPGTHLDWEEAAA